MLSHADRTRRHYGDAESHLESASNEPGETLTRPLSELDRYAGWLAKDHVSVAVRAGVHALGAALSAGQDASPLLTTLDRELARLPGGDLRKMLRKALEEIRTAIGPRGIDV